MCGSAGSGQSGRPGPEASSGQGAEFCKVLSLDLTKMFHVKHFCPIKAEDLTSALISLAFGAVRWRRSKGAGARQGRFYPGAKGLRAARIRRMPRLALPLARRGGRGDPRPSQDEPVFSEPVISFRVRGPCRRPGSASLPASRDGRAWRGHAITTAASSSIISSGKLPSRPCKLISIGSNPLSKTPSSIAFEGGFGISLVMIVFSLS